ncbi:Mitochondrial uncoupling protein 3, partial [Dryobates pubescens]
LQIQGEVRIPRAPSAVEYRGVWGTLSTIVRTEGPRGLYRGLAAGLQRQMSFASIRIGLYDSVKQLYTPKGAESKWPARGGPGEGTLGPCCAQPLPPAPGEGGTAQPPGAAAGMRNDSVLGGTWDAYRTIAREEGVRGLWRGSLPNIARNAIVNCGELVTYDLLKDALLQGHLMEVSQNLSTTSAEAPGRDFGGWEGGGRGRNHPRAIPAQVGLQLCSPRHSFLPSFLRLSCWNVVMFICYEQLQRALLLA